LSVVDPRDPAHALSLRRVGAFGALDVGPFARPTAAATRELELAPFESALVEL
jgi:hypothetical protein